MNNPDFKNTEYTAHLTQLNIVNDIYNGIDTAKNHLWKFEKESDFKTRQDQTSLDNYVFRTVDTIKSIIFRKPIDLMGVNNNQLIEWLEKINYKDDINEFSKKILSNRVRDGYTFILVDTSSYREEEIKSKADQEKANIRPYFVNILRSQVVNWETDEYGQYIRFSIKETYSERVGLYGLEYKEQIRMYELTNGKVEVSIWREASEVIGSRSTLQVPMIPIVQVGNDMIPPLYDQAKININHLNRNSEKSNYVRVGAAPFPIIKGQLEGESGEKTLSINQGLHFTDTDGSFEWAELSGNNYTMIQEEIKYLEEQMERKSVEFVTELKTATATEVEKASTSNESRLIDYSTELEQGINDAIELMQWYYINGSLGENFITVNKDFQSNILDIQQANFLLSLRTQNLISYDMMIDMLIKGEIIPFLDEKQRESEKLKLRDEVGEV